MGWIKRLGVNLLFIVVSTASMLLVAECVLRFTSFAKFLPYDGVPQYYYAASRDTGYDISKNAATSTHRFSDASYPLWSNNLGCFDYPYNNEQPYIYLAGDSFTWGFTPFEDKWGTVLESRVGQRVVKCGVPGSGTKQQYIKAQNILSTLPNPSHIIVGYFANDKGDDAAFPNSLVYEGKLIKNLSGDPTLTYDQLEARLPQYAEWAQEYCMWNMPANPALQRVKCYLRMHSILYLLAQQTVKDIVPISMLRAVGIVNENPPSVEVTDDSEKTHLENVAAFKTLATAHRAKLLFILIPLQEDVYSSATSTTYAAVTALLNEQGIEYFDPLAQFREAANATTTSFYWPTDPHLNPIGNRLLGYVVAEYMLTEQGNVEAATAARHARAAEFGL